MAKLDIDTTQMKKYGNELMNYSKKLENEINNIFDALLKISVNGTWNGKAATEYIKATQKDRKQYQNFVNSIYKDGKVLYDIGEYVEREVTYL